MRAPIAARYTGATTGEIEAAWQNEELRYKKMRDGGRVALREWLDEWLESLPEGTGKLERRGVHLLEKA